ncbi:MAG: beta galactosidase jelly roll domain-containing protein [Armatimonadetes bacterium]|nr:beta galactosidase jelly roll domain-containing protein [Armatimonadota bacterium]
MKDTGKKARLSATCFSALLYVLTSAIFSFAEPVPPIETSLNGEWDFVYSPSIKWQEGGKNIPVLPEDRDYSARMPVPAYWDDHLDGLKWAPFWSGATFNPKYRKIEFPLGTYPPDARVLNLTGIGFYRKIIDAPADWSGRRAVLYVGGARMYAWVWLNGEFIGRHETYNVPFEFALNTLKPGAANELVIAVANTYHTQGGLDAWGYQGSHAGIYRPVYLRVSGSARIADLYVYPRESNKNLIWNVELEGSGSSIDWLVRDPDTDRVLGRGTTPVSDETVTWTTESFGMKYWSDRDPNLYRLEIVLKQNGSLQDARVQDFGLRTIEREGINLRLNGRPILLRGTCDAYYFPLTCLAPTEVEPFRHIVRRLKETGFNWIRCHTWVPSEEYMQAADELGIMFQVEGPGGDYTDERWLQILRTCRRHPSVVVYCTANEHLLDEKRIEFVRKKADMVHEHVPDAMFNPMECLLGVDSYNGPDSTQMGEDYITKPYLLNPRRLKLLQEFSDVLAPNGGLSYATSGADWRKLDDRFSRYDRPVLFHELGIHGNYMNLDLEHRYEGTRIGTDLYAAIRKHMEENGVLDMAATYYYNSCQWMRILRKHCLETGRMSKYITGYDMLGAHDQHWHRSGYPCGMMNEFFEMKPGESEADALKYNGESIILLDCTQKRNLVSGQKCSFDVKSSLFGEGPLPEGRLSWQLLDSRCVVRDRGEISVKQIRNGVIENLGTISFTVPSITKPDKLTLSASLSGGEYEIVNDWNFWAFPKAAPTVISAMADAAILSKYGQRYSGFKPLKREQSGLQALSELNEDAVKSLNDGGSVVLLGSKPFPTIATGFDPCPTGRPEGNLATVVGDHPSLGAFPHEGWCDWQFYTLLTGGKAVVFSDIDFPFDPILEVVSSFKRIRKQANLFELGVGKGKLLVCTMNLDISDPGAAYLLDSMLSYAAGDSFKPKSAVSAAKIARLLGADPKDLGLPEIDPTIDGSLASKK